MSSLKIPSSQYQKQFLEFWYNEDSDARKTTDSFLNDWFVKTPNKSTGIFMQQFKPDVSQKSELECRKKSNSYQLLEFSNYQFCVARNKLDNFSTQRFAKRWKLPIETLMEEIKPLITEKHDFENRGDSKLKTFIAFSDIKILLQESEPKNFSIEFSSKTVEISVDMLMRECKPVATQNIKFED